VLIEYLIAAALALMGLTGAFVVTQDVTAMHSATYHLVIADNLLGEIEAQYLISGQPLQEMTAPCGEAANPPQKFCHYLEAGLRHLPTSRIEVLGANRIRLSWSETDGEQMTLVRALPASLSLWRHEHFHHGDSPSG